MNVFIIETPHQLLNAIEATHSLKLSDNYLIIITSDSYSKDTYSPLIQAESWKTVHYVSQEITCKNAIHRGLKYHKWQRVRGYLHQYELRAFRKRLDAIACSLGNAQNICLGNYWIAYMRHFANVLQHQRLYLLDDGTQTLQINDRRARGSSFEQYTNLQRLKLNLIKTLIGINDQQATSVTFFTTYDLETKGEDQVIKHDYSYLRSLAGAVPSSEEVFFLGSELREEGITLECYLDYFKKVLRYFEGEKIVYVMHQRESSEQIAYIKETLGVRVTHFGIPIEYQLTLRQTRPKILASFCSSALENCRVIFGDTLQIKSFYINPEDCRFNPDLIRDIYAYYESKNSYAFEVVRLPTE